MSESSISIQHQIRTQCETMTNSLKDMKKWELEMKQKEADMQASKADLKQNQPPLRNNVEAFNEYKEQIKKTETSSIDEDNKTTEESIDLKQRANEYKEKGNAFVKAQDYENAINMYSEAIKMYNLDPVFYSNRSQCYLKIEKYHECIEDTTQAIKLDPRLSKAFWRRMMAYEKLGEDILALKDCRVIIDLLPNDEKMKNDYDKIHNRILEAEKKRAREMVKWSRLSKEAEVIDYIKKSPHLRSKRPMKRIEIKPKKVFEQIPESTVETFEPKTDEMLSMADLEAQKCASTILLPKGGPQFLSVWKELSEQKRFLFLKNITDRNAHIGKLLGASLDSYIFSEIVGIINKYFAHYQIPSFKLLKGLSENPEMSILGMMLPQEDKTILSKLLDNSICGDNINTDEINVIKKKFCIS
ncbi:unnamed protein product [Diamesa serratosioi]